MNKKAAVIGVGETPYRTRTPETFPELVYNAVQKALNDANMTIDEIDAVVFGMSPSEFMGVNEPHKWAVDAMGAIKKPLLRVHTGGATGGSAAQAGYWHVASGMFKSVLVVAADKIGETPDAQLVLNTIWDPFYEKVFGLHTMTMTAFKAVRHMHKYGTTEEQMALVAVQARKNAMNNPNAHLKGKITVEDVLKSRVIAWPIKLYDSCPRSSGAAAVVIANEEIARKKCEKPAWITGVAETASTIYMGDRMGVKADMDYADLDELMLAAKVAYKMAGIENPRKQIDVVEVYDPFTIITICSVEALGLCSKGEASKLYEQGYWAMDGEIPVNPSGGVLCSNPIAASGLVRVCDAALQVMGKAGKYQVKKEVHHAVATAVGGSFQFLTCTILSSDEALKRR
ncbi:MAG: thiolase family protein [Candidatus Baldrarchaeia archaeon]|nr:MAG: thiolase family protein [Candidatus Bathyarchaeota archaeon]